MMSSYNKLLFVAKIALTFVIFWFLYHHSQLQFGLLYAFVAHPIRLLIVMGLCYLMVVFHAWRWFRLNTAQHIGLPFIQTILPAYIAIAFNTVLPGSVGGDVYRLYLVVKKFPAQKSKAVLAIFVDRVIGLLGILIIACVAAPFYFDVFRHNTALFTLLVVCYVVCTMSLFGFAAIILFMSESESRAARLESRLRNKRYARQLLALLEAIHLFRNAKWVIFESFLLSIATQMLLLVAVWQINYVMALPPLSPVIYLLALVVGQIANLAPLTPGGLGVGEAAFGNIIFLLTGNVGAYATVFFALRLVSTLAYLPGALIGSLGMNFLHHTELKVDQVISS
jgi:uncharacterized protein (TIRG00374 family)